MSHCCWRYTLLDKGAPNETMVRVFSVEGGETQIMPEQESVDSPQYIFLGLSHRQDCLHCN